MGEVPLYVGCENETLMLFFIFSSSSLLLSSLDSNDTYVYEL